MANFDRASAEASSFSGCRRAVPAGWRTFTTSLSEADRLAEEGERRPSDRARCIVAVKRVGVQIGLKAADLLLLDTLTAFTQPQDWSAGQRPIVWASNAYLMERTGFSLSTLKRHARRLAEVGVITFRDSPNGKRWGRRDVDGVIVEAYGFDLSPLSARLDEFEALADELAEERALCQRLRRRITIARRSIRARLEAADGKGQGGRRMATLQAAFETLLAQLPGARAPSNILDDVYRRLADLLCRVERLFSPEPLSDAQATTSENLNPREASSEPHIQDTNQLQSVDSKSLEESSASFRQEDEKTGIGIELRTILQSCPEFASWGTNLDSDLKDWRDLVWVADRLRPMIGVSDDAWMSAQQQMGRTAAAAALALVFEKFHADEVRSPGGYLRGMATKARAGELHLARSFFGRLCQMAA